MQPRPAPASNVPSSTTTASWMAEAQHGSPPVHRHSGSDCLLRAGRRAAPQQSPPAACQRQIVVACDIYWALWTCQVPWVLHGEVVTRQCRHARMPAHLLARLVAAASRLLGRGVASAFRAICGACHPAGSALRSRVVTSGLGPGALAAAASAGAQELQMWVG
jgi:hypothetical protein